MVNHHYFAISEIELFIKVCKISVFGDILTVKMHFYTLSYLITFSCTIEYPKGVNPTRNEYIQNTMMYRSIAECVMRLLYLKGLAREVNLSTAIATITSTETQHKVVATP